MRWKRVWERTWTWAAPQAEQAKGDVSTTVSLAEQERSRRGRLLAMLLLTALPVTVLIQSVFLALLPGTNLLVSFIAMLILFGICVNFNRRGNVDLASRSFLLGMLLLRALFLFRIPTHLLPLSGFFYIPFAFPILTSGFLVGRRAPFGFALACAGFLAAHVALHARDFAAIPAFHTYSPTVLILLPAVIFLALAVLAWLGAGSMEDAIARAGQVDELEALYHEAEYQRRLAEHLRELAARLTGELDSEELLRRIIGGVSALGYAGCAILLTEAGPDGKCCLVGHLSTLGNETDITALRYTEDDSEAAATLSGQIRCIHDPVTQAGYDTAMQQRLRALHVVDQLALPICYQGEVLGALVVWASDRVLQLPRSEIANSAEGAACLAAGPFSVGEVVYLSTLADHAALALGNAMLHQEMLAAHEGLEQEHQAVITQAGELAVKNLELLSVQAELEAQYRALETANAQLSALATTDGMTGLANHRAFQEELARQVARAERAHTPLSLLLLDVDHFKQYNDTFGHPAGDEILKTVGQILHRVVREGDFPARYGGEEFAVILPDTEIETAVQVAERLRATVEAHAFAHRRITISVGVSAHRPEETTATMLQYADMALYEAKAAGRNCVLYPQPDSSAETAPVLGAEAMERAGNASRKPVAQVKHTSERVVSAFAEGPEQDGKARSQERSQRYFTRLTQYAQLKATSLLTGGLEGLLQEPTVQVLSALLDALDRRGAEPRGHSERVARYALLLSNTLAALYEEKRHSRPLLPRLTPGDLIDLAFGALLHDIGKVGIPDSILRKTDKLTEEEWQRIRRHPLAGAEMIADCPLLSRALPVVRFHHERWDGTGYPQGLAGEGIPLGARIFAVCDTFDILTTDRPYRARLEFAEAREEIIRESGKQFDPDVVEAFLRISEQEWQFLGDRPLSLESSANDLSRAA